MSDDKNIQVCARSTIPGQRVCWTIVVRIDATHTDRHDRPWEEVRVRHTSRARGSANEGEKLSVNTPLWRSDVDDDKDK